MADGSVIIDTELDQNGLKKGLAGLGTTLTKGISAAVAAAGTALVGLGSYSIKVGSDFEYAISGVAATMGKTADEITEIRDKAKELGSSTKFTATEAAEGFDILAQAGLSLDEQLQAIDATLALASAGEMSMDSAAGYLTTTIKAMSASTREAGLGMDDAARVADLYAKGATLAKTSTAEFGDAMSKSAAMAGSYNQSLDTTGAALLALAEGGYSGSEAGTYLSRAMADLYAPSSNASKALDALNVSAYDSSGKAKDLVDVVDELEKAMAGMTEEEKNATTAQIFTSAGLKAYNTIASQGTEKIRGFSEELKHSSITAKSLDEQLGKSGTSLKELEKRAMDAGLSAEDFALSWQECGKDGGAFIDNLSESLYALDGRTRSTEEITDMLGISVDELKEAFNSASGAAQEMSETKLDNLQGDITKLQSATEGFGISFYDALSGVGEGTNMMRDFVQEATDIMGELDAALKEGGFDGLVDALGDALTRAVNKIIEYIPMIIEMGVKLVSSLVQGLSESAGGIANAATNLISILIDGILSITTDLVKLGGELIIALCEGLSDNSESIISSIVLGLLKLSETIVDYIPNLIQAGSDLLHGITIGLKKAIPALAIQIPNILKDLFKGLQDVLPDLIFEVSFLVESLVSELPSLIGFLVDAIPDLLKIIGDTLIDSGTFLINIFFKDILGSILNALPEIIKLIVGLLPEQLQTVLNVVSALTPQLLYCVIDAVKQIVGLLPQIIRTIITIIPPIIESVVEAITELLPEIIEAGIMLFTALIQALPDIINAIVLELPKLIDGIIGALLELLPLIIDCGVQLFVGLVQALPDIIYAIVNVLPVIISAVISALVGMIPLLIECGIDLFVSLVKALPQIIIAIVAVIPQILNSIIQALIDSIPLIIQCGIDLLVSLIGALPDIISAIVLRLPEIINAIISALLSNIKLIIDSGIKLFVSLVAALPTIIIQIVKAIPEIILAIVKAFKDSFHQIVTVGKDLMVGLWNGIVDTKDWILNKIKGICGDIFDKIKGFFGINSPSKLFRDMIGENLMLGIAVGVDDTADEAVDSVEDAAEKIANVKFKAGTVDYSGIAENMKATVANETYISGRSVSAPAVSATYVQGSTSNDYESNPETNGKKPEYVENNIYIDGKKTARVLTPYVSKELEWEGK